MGHGKMMLDGALDNWVLGLSERYVDCSCVAGVSCTSSRPVHDVTGSRKVYP
jgi:hypothetical protein